MSQRANWSRFLTVDRVALGLAAVVIMLAAASTDNPASGTTQRDLDGWAAVLLITTTALLFGSRRFPGTVALAVLGLSFLWYGVGYTSGLINVPILVAYYSLGRNPTKRTTFAVSTIAVVALLIVMAGVGDESLRSALTAAGYVVMAVLFGEFIHNRQLLVEHLADRAEQAEADAERRVAQERLSIARDIHDVLAHTVSAMTVQAEVAADAVDRDLDEVRTAVHAIRQAGTEAMGDVRATVAVLRSGAIPSGTTPVPQIANVDELASTAREQGVDVELDSQLAGRQLPEMLELTIYRIVQEALTNVVRHADATSARVTIHEKDSAVLVEVRDDGRAQATGRTTAGFGLRGMAERVEAVGGELWHGRDGATGWVVRASLPLPVKEP